MKDYLDWRGDLSMITNLPCEVDLLIFSQLVYAPLENLHELHGQSLQELTSVIYPEPPKKEEGQLALQHYELWNAAVKCERFQKATLKRFVSRFDKSSQTQFAAAFFVIGQIGIAVFRGTDSTLIGWKEDFNLAFEEKIPSQQEAVSFLNNVGEHGGYLYVCGHSKGGNLAMYSSAMCSEQVKQRILYVANFDGPGMTAEFVASPQWLSVKNRIHTFVPESSIIGMLFTTGIDPVIVESDSSGIMQHNPFYWHIMGGSFVLSKQKTISSKIIDEMMDLFISGCTPKQKRTLTDTLYEVLSLSDAKYLREIPSGLMRHSKEVLETLRNLSPEEKNEFSAILRIWGNALYDSLVSNGQELISSNLLSPILDKLAPYDKSSQERLPDNKSNVSIRPTLPK